MGAPSIRFRVQFSAPGCGIVLTPALDYFDAGVARRLLAAHGAEIVIDTRAMRVADREPFTVCVDVACGVTTPVNVVNLPRPRSVLTAAEIGVLTATAPEPNQRPGRTLLRVLLFWLDRIVTRLIGPRRPIGTHLGFRNAKI
jgi:hypothetical protein